MFCPVCRDEYRKEFTRCATCAVDLVERLDAASIAPGSTPAVSIGGPSPEVELTVPYCGYLALEEAREARNTLRPYGIHAVIVITEAHGAEEFWLRVARADAKATTKILGRPEQVDPADAFFHCSACGAKVGASEKACPGCGLEFEE